jgi:predicted secreted hydrolase
MEEARFRYNWLLVTLHNGYTDYTIGGYTYYDSRVRIEGSGTVLADGVQVPVTGTAWFDHQWGDLNNVINVG